VRASCHVFDDDFGEFEDHRFMEEDQFADGIMDDPDGLNDDSITDDPESDEFPAKEAFFIGGAMGWAYEEGLAERKRRELIRKLIRKK